MRVVLGSFVPRDTRLGTAPIPPLLTQYNLFGDMTKRYHGNVGGWDWLLKSVRALTVTLS